MNDDKQGFFDQQSTLISKPSMEKRLPFIKPVDVYLRLQRPLPFGDPRSNFNFEAFA